MVKNQVVSLAHLMLEWVQLLHLDHVQQVLEVMQFYKQEEDQAVEGVAVEAVVEVAAEVVVEAVVAAVAVVVVALPLLPTPLQHLLKSPLLLKM